MNIKSSLFYAAIAACLGTGFAGGVAVSQRDIDNAGMGQMRMQCEETDAERQFRMPQPNNSKGAGF
jgi:hypothetical protein